jgi:hypothetical protein
MSLVDRIFMEQAARETSGFKNLGLPSYKVRELSELRWA